MTSEILIMTPSAIAMAADSVVTVNNNKTYEGVNKLFMLSNNPPMGIMIFNNSEFLGIPYETIIKHFRTKIIDENVNTVTEFREKFREYLETETKKNFLIKHTLKDKIDIFIRKINSDISNFNEDTLDEWMDNNKELNIFEEYTHIFSEELLN